MWPNIYSRINPPTQTDMILSEIEKRKIINDLILQQDLERYKAFHSTLAPASATDSKNINITIGGLDSSVTPKIEISSTPYNSTATISTKTNDILLNPTPAPLNPDLVSSYDLPNISKYTEYLATHTYNMNNPPELRHDLNLLKELKEAQEKLRYAQKLEKTTDLVDDIIKKAEHLQSEMKKKSELLKLQKSIDEFNKEKNDILLRKSYTDLYERLSRERVASSSLDLSSDLNKYYINHYHHVHTLRPKSPVSILKYSSSGVPERVRLLDRRSSRSNSRRASVSFVCKCRTPNNPCDDVGPRVDSWNCNCKIDSKIY
jgi:hypothetical protein